GRFRPSMAPEIAAVPGVERVQMMRNGRTTFRQKPAMILALEMSSIAETVHRPPVAGDAVQMYRQAASGDGVIVSDSFAQLQHLRLGDPVEIAAPYGVLSLPIVGVIIDYTDQQGTILMDRSVVIKYWRDESVNMFRIYLKPDAAALTVRQQIAEMSAHQRHVFVLTNRELKSYITRVLV